VQRSGQAKPLKPTTQLENNHDYDPNLPESRAIARVRIGLVLVLLVHESASALDLKHEKKETYSISLERPLLQDLHNAIIDIVSPKLIVQAGVAGAIKHTLGSVSAVRLGLAYGL
jgi:hypothetical protein